MHICYLNSFENTLMHAYYLNSFEKTLMLGNIEGRKRKGWQRMRWLDGITDSMDMSLSKLRELVMGRKAWHTAVHVVAESDMIKWLNWVELMSPKMHRTIVSTYNLHKCCCGIRIILFLLCSMYYIYLYMYIISLDFVTVFYFIHRSQLIHTLMVCILIVSIYNNFKFF